MPLLDHFHPPLKVLRHWTSFHHGWAVFIASALNTVLPPDYFAEPHVQFNIEIDAAAFEGSSWRETNPPPTWTPPAPVLTLPLPLITDVVEVRVFGTRGGPTLAAAVELISPANKDRPEQRDAFVSKCAAYLQEGIGLLIIDIVTERRENLHDALLVRLLNGSAPALGAPLYTVAYRPVSREGQSQFDIWPQELVLGCQLPVLPLALRGGISVPVELESAYERTCREQRIPPGGFGANGPT